MDEIRLAVADAFFSVPRGGAEIGGVLLGTREGRRLEISGYVPLDCEHANGPSFTLSPADHSRLADLLAQWRGNQDRGEPVGWYHSHTRSDIFLSPEDLEIHKRYFPEPWQVALVMKPHTFEPTRAGFFFRESDGTVRSTASYREFLVEPLTGRQWVSAAAASAGSVAPEPPAPSNASAINPPDEPAIFDRPVAETVADLPDPHPLPAFAQTEPATKGRLRLPLVLVGVTIGLASAVAAVQTRELWIPRVKAVVGTAPSTTAVPAATAAGKELFIGLSLTDHEGQLQILWSRDSAAVHDAEEGNLVIDDVGVPKAIPLDRARLRTGTFTYDRQGERVDVAMTLHLPNGQRVREVTTYLGRVPTHPVTAAEPDVLRDRSDLDQELKLQKARTKRLEKSVDEMRQELQREQRRRLENQSPTADK